MVERPNDACSRSGPAPQKKQPGAPPESAATIWVIPSFPSPSTKLALFVRAMNHVAAGKAPKIVFAQRFFSLWQLRGYEAGDIAVNRPQVIESRSVLCDNLLSSPGVTAVKVVSVDNDFMNHVPHELPIVILQCS
jgi:hypothetical protein